MADDHEPGRGGDGGRELVPGRDDDANAVAPHQGAEGPENAGVLFVGRHDLVARSPVDQAERAGDPIAGACGQGDLGRRRAEQPTPGVARAGFDLVQALVVGEAAASLAG